MCSSFALLGNQALQDELDSWKHCLVVLIIIALHTVKTDCLAYPAGANKCLRHIAELHMMTFLELFIE